MIIRFNENLQVEEIYAEESINAGNNLVNEIKVFMPSNFDFNIHKGYINFKLSDGKEYNNLFMERVKKENIQLVQEMCYYYVLPKFLTKQKGTIDLSVRISPISNTNVIANTGVIKAEINYAVFENGDEVLDPDTAEELRKDISESESALKLYVQETIEDGYDLRVIGTVDSINDLPKNLTFNDVGISYFVGITYPRDVYTWGYLNDMELGWSNQGPLKVLSDDPVLEFANSEWEKSYNLCQTNSSSVRNFDTQCNLEANKTYYVHLKIVGYISFSLKYGSNSGNILKTYYDKTGNVDFEITPSESGTIYIDSWNSTLGDFVGYEEIMISKNKLPYQEWNGEIMHEKDIEPVLLWENANPNSEFAGQTAELRDSADKYSLIRIDIKRNNASSSGPISLFIKPTAVNCSYPLSTLYYFSGTEYRYSRACTFYRFTGLNFDNCYSNNAENNYQMIPVAIYGYKY